MKKLSLITVTLCLLFSCAVFKHRYYLGMTEAEWKKKNMAYTVVDQTKDGAVYSIPSSTGPPLFVYFDGNGKLIRVAQGVREPDVIIMNR